MHRQASKSRVSAVTSPTHLDNMVFTPSASQHHDSLGTPMAAVSKELIFKYYDQLKKQLETQNEITKQIQKSQIIEQRLRKLKKSFLFQDL